MNLDFLQWGVSLAKAITDFLGEFEASGILKIVSDFLGGEGAKGLITLIQNLLGFLPL